MQERNNKGIMILLVVALAVFFLYPLKDIFGTIRPEVLLSWLKHDEDFLKIIKESFSETGLISTGVGIALDIIPQLLKLKITEYGSELYQVTKIVMIFLAILFMANGIKKIGGSDTFALFFVGLSFITLQNLSSNDAINGYEFSVHFSLIAFSFSLSSLALYFKSQCRIFYLLVSAIFLILAIACSEFYILFILSFIFLGFIFFARAGAPIGSNFNNFFLKISFFFIAFFFVTAGIYYYFFNNLGLRLDKTDFSIKNITNLKFINTYIQYTLSGIPLYNFLNLSLPLNNISLNEFYHGVGKLDYGVKDYLLIIKSSWVVKAIVTIVFIWQILPKIKIKNYHMIAICIIGISFIIFPNLIISFSKKYQEQYEKYNQASSYATYFNQIGWLLVIAIICEELYRLSAFLSKFIGKIILMIICILFMFISLSTDFWNDYINAKESKESKKWQYFTTLLQSDSFQKIPDKSNILVNSLYEKSGLEHKLSFNHSLDNKYWESFFHRFNPNNKKVMITAKPEEFESLLIDNVKKPGYVIIYREEYNSNNSYIIMAETSKLVSDKDFVNISSKKADLFHFSQNHEFNIAGVLNGNNVSSKDLIVSDLSYLYLKDNFFFAKVTNDAADSMPITLQCKSCTFDPGALMISYYNDIDLYLPKKVITEPKFNSNFEEPIRAKWLNNEELSFWHWSKFPRNNIISINNRTGKNSFAIISMKIFSYNSGDVKINFNNMDRVEMKISQKDAGKKASNINIENKKIMLYPGKNFIKIDTTFPKKKLPDANLKACFSIVDFDVKYGDFD